MADQSMGGESGQMMRKCALRCVALGLVAMAAMAAPKSDVADAAMRGDRSAVQTLLQQKADVNAQQIDGTSALHWAVQANDLQLTDLLLRAGAKPAAANKAGAT